MTTSDNEWQLVTTSGTKSDNNWQRVTTGNTTSDNKWQQIAMSNSEWQQWYNQWKRHSTLQRTDDCRPFNDKDWYTTTSRDGWLQSEWLNKYTFLKVFQESNQQVAVLIKILISNCCQRLSVLYNPWKNGWLQPLL